MTTVQLLGRERRDREVFEGINADHRDEWLTQVRNFAVYFPVVEFLGAFSTALIFLYVGISILSAPAGAETAATIKADMAKWGKLIKDSGIRE